MGAQGTGMLGDGSLTALWVVGGEQRTPRSLLDAQPAWSGYAKGLVVGVDLAGGATSRRLEYVTPPEVRAGDDAAISFQAGAQDERYLYLCTETEVLVYDRSDLRLAHYISLPWFNDVHHVCPAPNGNLLVASAGLELVIEVTLEGEVARLWNVLGEDPWERFDPDTDYRKVASTKPHRAHPNFIFCIGEDVWATRFHQGDAVCLTAEREPVHVSDRRVHDGIVVDGRVYFTTVDANVIVMDAESFEVVERYDLNGFHGERSALLGWCRGLLLDGERLWVGFSRIRPTRFRENVAWVARGFRQGLPTHIACYDLAQRTCLSEINLEDAGLSAVYSIFPATPDGAGGGRDVRRGTAAGAR